MMRRLCGVLVVVLLLWGVGETLAQDLAQTITPNYSDTIYTISRRYNICVMDLLAANPSLIRSEYQQLPQQIIVPIAPLCYEEIKLEYNETGGVLEQVLAILKTRNLCPEEIHPYNYDGGYNATIYIPLETLPCYNEQVERLRYFNDEGEWLDTPVYSADPRIPAPQWNQPGEYCYGDLRRANPQMVFFWTFSVEVFVTDQVRRCEMQTVNGGETLYDFSKRLNVCMDAIWSAHMWVTFQGVLAQINQLQVPVDAPPCYDENGLRIGANDKAAHLLQNGEALIDVAQQYDVCLNDLMAANSLINRHDNRVPNVLFIPNTAACNETYPLEHRVQEGDSLDSLSKFYNVCFNRIIEATGNKNIQYKKFSQLPEGYNSLPLELLKPDSVVLIPDRPDCYTMDYGVGSYEMQPHICYSEAVDFTKDYTGHEPPISFTYDTESGYCTEYGLRDNYILTIIYENQTLYLYQMDGGDPLSLGSNADNYVTIGQCFGVDPYELIEIQARDAINDLPQGYIILPPDYDRDCYLITADIKTRAQKARELGYKAGYVDENGIYTVNYNDTLGSIGRKYGYLPQWIAEYNHLPDTRMIYYRQELKLPPYPSLYDFAKLGIAVVGTLTVSGIIFGVYRWRTSGKRKRKNDEKVA